MKPLLIVSATFGTLFYIAACAGASAGGGPSSERLEPPQLLSRGAPPSLRIPMTTAARSPVRVTIEVLIDETGRPNMSTFKVTGFGASKNQEALARWIEQATLRAARRAGEPVAALYRMTLEARVRSSVRQWRAIGRQVLIV